MTSASTHRRNILRTAAKLFRKNGYSSTGLTEILTESKAPKGSLYYYFPGGKEQLGEEALRYAADSLMGTLEELAKSNQTAPSLLLAFASLLADWMKQSGYQDGCPMATTILETVPASAGITAAAFEAFSSWRGAFGKLLERDGMSSDEARRLSSLAVAALEGSLIQARIERSDAPILEAAALVAWVMEERNRSA